MTPGSAASPSTREPDIDALHVTMADEAYALGGQTAAESYLDIAKILGRRRGLRRRRGPPRLRLPGRERGFAREVIDAGLTWIGPPPAAIGALGDKVSGPAHRPAVGAPLAPGTDGPVSGARRG